MVTVHRTEDLRFAAIFVALHHPDYLVFFNHEDFFLLTKNSSATIIPALAVK